MADKAEREQRLAEALRANLRRRKAQARAQDEAPPFAPDDLTDALRQAQCERKRRADR